MSIPNVQERQQANGARLAEAAPYVCNNRNRLAFGAQHLKVCAQVRRDIRDALTEEPLMLQAWKARSAGDHRLALQLFQRCLENGADFSDPRFFGVFWGLAQTFRSLGNRTRALQLFKEAITRYPKQMKESYFMEAADVILEMRPDAQTDAAAMLLWGINQLGFIVENGTRSDLVQRYLRLELRRTNEVRPPPFRDLQEDGLEPINALAAKVTGWVMEAQQLVDPKNKD